MWYSMYSMSAGTSSRRRWLGLVIAFLVTAATSSAAPAMDCPTEDRPRVGAVGTVRDLLTDAPIAGAQVYAGGAAPGVSDSVGCFVAAGTYAGACSYYSPECAPECIRDCPFDVGVQAEGYEGTSFHGYFNMFPLLVDFRLASLAAIACSGDCNADDTVGIDELVDAVAAALRTESRGCADADHDGSVSVSDLVTAIRNALTGCLTCEPGSCSTFE